MSTDEKTILVIDDEKDIVFILSKYLSDEGYRVCSLLDGGNAAAEAVRIAPDLILLDVKMPGKDGYQVKAELNENPATADIPVIFLSSSVSTLDKVTGLRLHAYDYVTKPFDSAELLARIDATLNRHQRYEDISTKDALTGLPNAEFFRKELAISFAMAKRYGRVFTVGFIDIDNFKTINDTFGHLTGDSVLREAANRMMHAMRSPDVLSRYGGDEFCVIIREATGENARIALTRLKSGIEEKPFQELGGSREFSVMISFGIVTYQDSFSSVEEFMALADERMYGNKLTNLAMRGQSSGSKKADA